MTHEEAIKMLDRIRDESGWTNDAYDSLTLAIEALKKQIPKKPLHMHKNYYCPICKEDGWLLWDDAVPNDMDKYCGICGQAIDWSDDE